MVTDKFGCGAFAQHALVDGESRSNMECAVSAFKTNNPSWREVKVIIIDKDFTELALLHDEFPDATVILCHFHVIDYLNREVSKRNYGFTSFEKTHVKNLMTMMVRAVTESSFDHYVSAMKKLCKSRPAFMDYFEANWLSCKKLWCTFKRGDIPHLDNNTNNRLEASWGAAKEILHRHMAMDECIDHLLFLQQSAEDEYGAKVKRVGYRYNHEYDDEMRILAKFATRHACDFVEQQYKLSCLVKYRLSVDEVSPTYINLTNEDSGGTYAVQLEKNTCSCSFHQTLCLPCRHVMYVRRQKEGFHSVIPHDSIPERWLIADEDDADDAAATPQMFSVHEVEVSSGRVPNQNEKYRAGFAVCQRIAEVIADKGARSFHEWLVYLKRLEDIARLDGVVPDLHEVNTVATADTGGAVVTTSDTFGSAVAYSDRVGVSVTNSAPVCVQYTDRCGVDDTDADTNSLSNNLQLFVDPDSGLATQKSIVGEESTNSITNSARVGKEVTNSVTNSITNSGIVGKVAINSFTNSAIVGEEVTKASITSATRRRLILSYNREETSVVAKPHHDLFVKLNPASKPSGRPKQKKATKKAKARKDFENTKAFAAQLNTFGDVTLATLRDYIGKRRLSISSIEPVLSAIRPMYEKALYKRPKARVKLPGETLQIESDIRFVLPELLVNKSAEAGKNAAFRERSNARRTPAATDVAVHILDVGMFSLQDIETMKEWHDLSKKIKRTRTLIKWVESKPHTEERRTILAKIPVMNMSSAFKSHIGETIVQFEDLTKFASENWLSDGCVLVAALQVAGQTRNAGVNSGGVEEVLVVDPVFLGFETEPDRKRMLDTRKQILSKGAKGRIIFFPVNIRVDIEHWCGAIVDFRSCIIWIYDPLQRSDYLDEVERIMKDRVIPIIDPAFTFLIRYSNAWLQKDGYSCGILVVKWFETYLQVAMNSNPDDDLQTISPRLMLPSDTEDCRFKMFTTVFLDVCGN